VEWFHQACLGGTSVKKLVFDAILVAVPILIALAGLVKASRRKAGRRYVPDPAIERGLRDVDAGRVSSRSERPQPITGETVHPAEVTADAPSPPRADLGASSLGAGPHGLLGRSTAARLLTIADDMRSTLEAGLVLVNDPPPTEKPAQEDIAAPAELDETVTRLADRGPGSKRQRRHRRRSHRDGADGAEETGQGAGWKRKSSREHPKRAVND